MAEASNDLQHQQLSLLQQQAGRRLLSLQYGGSSSAAMQAAGVELLLCSIRHLGAVAGVAGAAGRRQVPVRAACRLFRVAACASATATATGVQTVVLRWTGKWYSAQLMYEHRHTEH